MSTQLIEPIATSPLPVEKSASAWKFLPSFLRERQWRFILALSGLLLFGAAVRVHPMDTFPHAGYDETLYETYTEQLKLVGLAGYPDIVDEYIVEQTKTTATYLPPTRLLYIVCSYCWRGIFGGEAIPALHAVSTLFSILTLVLCAAWTRRLAGRTFCLATVALMACAPVEIHLAQRSMIDGFFAFWALLAAWALWESLRAPGRFAWQIVMAGALAAMVLTKENAFFIYVALLGLIGLNYKFRFGTVTPRLLLMMFAGPLLGAVILLFAAGGLENTIHVYRLLIDRAYILPYAIKNCDGPWHRYLVDMLLMSPLVLLLAIMRSARLRFADKASLYFLGFIVVSYVIMCNLKYGMNLRYATVWDFPLRYLAVGQLMLWSRGAGKHSHWLLAALVGGVCLYELRQYYIFFVRSGLYELVTLDLLRAVNIYKP